MMSIAAWARRAGKTVVKVEACGHFDARGLLRVYGRGDQFHRTFNMDIWLSRDGRLLMRFWSRSLETDERSFEILGMEPAKIPIPKANSRLAEAWVPQAVRKEYDKWIQEEW